MKKKIILGSLLVLLLTGGLLDDKGRIEGTVTDTDGNPINEATVEILFSEELCPENMHMYSSADKQTNANGYSPRAALLHQHGC